MKERGSTGTSLRWRQAIGILVLLAVGAATDLSAKAADLPARSADTAKAQFITQAFASDTLRVLTLNLAHGRKDALNQLLVSRPTIERNLGEAAELFRTAGADLVALQEADGPSRWSGRFDHVQFLAAQAGYPWHARSGHAQSWLYDYGTALLSRAPFTDQLSHAFEPTPPSLTKGFTLGQVALQPRNRTAPVRIDVVSVHLDFSRETVRARQTAEMVQQLSRRGHPVIVLGDLNSDWSNKDSAVSELAGKCGLHTYEPTAQDLGTYRSSGRRLDWVLISRELEFIHLEVLPEVVSDHQAVVADIRLKEPGQLITPATTGCSA